MFVYGTAIAMGQPLARPILPSLQNGSMSSEMNSEFEQASGSDI
jgi:hypothetical protein